MSRSQRKNPIMGITTCRSERQDKKIWHQRWRARLRTQLANTATEDLDAILPILENEVSNIWSMGKDGKQYFPLKNQHLVAERIVQNKNLPLKEKESLKQRFIHKSMGK